MRVTSLLLLGISLFFTRCQKNNASLSKIDKETLNLLLFVRNAEHQQFRVLGTFFIFVKFKRAMRT